MNDRPAFMDMMRIKYITSLRTGYNNAFKACSNQWFILDKSDISYVE